MANQPILGSTTGSRPVAWPTEDKVQAASGIHRRLVRIFAKAEASENVLERR